MACCGDSARAYQRMSPQDARDKFFLLVGRRGRAGRARWQGLRLGLSRRAAVSEQRQDVQRVLAQQQTDDDDDDDPAYPEVHATDSGRSFTGAFFYIVATTEILPAHRGLLDVLCILQLSLTRRSSAASST